jgi:hypothetical protein
LEVTVEDWEIEERARAVSEFWRKLRAFDRTEESLNKELPELKEERARIYQELEKLFTTPATEN